MSNFIRSFKARKLFLDQLAVGSSVSFAAAAAGGTVKNFKRWRETDPDFAADWEEAIEEGTDLLEDAAFDRGLKKSDTLAMFMLKARRPDKFDRGSKLELSGGISVEGSKTKLLNKIARLQARGKLPEGGGDPEPEVSEEASAEDQVLALPAPDDQNGLGSRGRKRRAATQGSRRSAAA